MTGLGSNAPAQATTRNGGFNVANSIAIGLIAVFTLCVLVALCYSIYYHQAKLKLRRADLERSERPESPEAQVTGVNLEASVTPTSPNMTTAGPPADIAGRSVTMAPLANSALQSTEEELKSTAMAETKTKAVMLEDKSLGRCEDIRPVRHNFDELSLEGQLFAFRSSRT